MNKQQRDALILLIEAKIVKQFASVYGVNSNIDVDELEAIFHSLFDDKEDDKK